MGKDAGLSAVQAAEQSLAVAETINQAIQLSSGSAESANAAIAQLIQGLQSGVLRGEEFNSMMEQAPRLARGYVRDPDVYAVDLSATPNAGVLHYRLSVAPNQTGRFPPLAPASDRQLRVVTQVTGSTLAQNRLDCRTNSAVCPRGYEGNVGNQALVEGLCDSQDPPWCLRAARNEDSMFNNLRNMEGTVPVPATRARCGSSCSCKTKAATTRTTATNQIQITYEADPDETTRASLPLQTQSSPLVENASFPNPVGAGVTGNLSHGYGRVLDNRVDRGEGVRALNDYDAVPTDFDRFEFTLPGDSA